MPLLGVRWHPIIDRSDWEHPQNRHRADVWDRAAQPDAAYEGSLHDPTAEAFLRAQTTLAAAGFAPTDLSH